jgi:hypothetical protein
MTTGIASRLARIRGLKFVALEAELHLNGERAVPQESQSLFLPGGYCYGALTHYPLDFDIPIMAQCRSTLIVRDPRDVLVSLYYSMKYSHPLPGETSSRNLRNRFSEGRQFAHDTGIDRYVQVAMPQVRARLASYVRVLNLPTMKWFRYEDVIYRKREWVEEMCDHFLWNIKPSQRNAIADAYDVFPSEEEQDKHIRQVHPGNYKSQLQEATIRSIEAHFGDEMKVLGYEPYEGHHSTGAISKVES